MAKLIFFIIPLLLVACSPMPDPTEISPEVSSNLRFLALGDSYTIGESVTPDERWPMQLQAALAAKKVSINTPEIIARTGWTTEELIVAIDEQEPQGSYDLVSLLIGVNNHYRGYSSDTYRLEFRNLLETALHLAGDDPQRVIVLSIPDWGITPFAEGRDQNEIAAQIDLFNSIAADEAVRLGARYIDITSISRLSAIEPELIADDGLHPSGIMYAQWVELLLPIACEILSK